jgi:hypothetical protein
MIKELELKKGWNEISIHMWQELNSVERENDLAVIIERMAILGDTDSDNIRALPIPQFRRLQDEIVWVGEKFKPDVQVTFILNGVRYGMIPDLNFITTGEWADIDNWKDDTIGNIHLICALIYRPVTRYVDNDDYDIEPHKSQGFQKRADLFLNKLPITTVYGAVLFFSSSGIQFIEIIADYLEAEAKETETKTTKTTRTRKATKKNK